MFLVPKITTLVKVIYDTICHLLMMRLVRDSIILGTATQYAHLRNNTTVVAGFLDPFEVWMIRRNVRKS